MKISRCGLIWLFACIGCSTVSSGAAIEKLQSDLTERTAVVVDWDLAKEGPLAIDRCVKAKLAAPLSPDDAVAIALLRNPKLKALYHELGVAQSDLVAAGLPEKPAFTVERRFSGKALEFDVAEEFISIFLIPLRQRIAESLFDAERLRITHEVLNHTAEVRGAYFGLQASLQLVEMRRLVLRSAEAALETANALREAGNTNMLVVLQHREETGRARIELANSEAEVVENRERMNVLLGLWGAASNWTIPMEVLKMPADDLTIDEAEQRAIEGRLDLAAARSQVNALRENLGLTQITSLVPDLTIGGHSEREPEGTTTRGPSLSFGLPIFDWGRAARARAKSQLLQAEERFAELAIEIRSEVRTLVTRMAIARRKADFYHISLLPVHQRSTEETQRLYNGMFVGVFELLEAKHRQVNAGRDYIQAMLDYWVSRSELEKAIGKRLPTGPLPPVVVEDTKSVPGMHHHRE